MTLELGVKVKLISHMVHADDNDDFLCQRLWLQNMHTHAHNNVQDNIKFLIIFVNLWSKLIVSINISLGSLIKIAQ